MTLQRVQRATLGETTGSSTSATLTSVTSGNWIIAWAWGAGSTNAALSATGCTDNQSHTLSSALNTINWDGSFGQAFGIYYFQLPASYGTYTVTISDANLIFGVSIVIAEYQDLLASPSDQQASNGSVAASVTTLGTGTTATNSASTVLAVSLVTNGNSLGSYSYTQTGGTNWPTGSTSSSTTGGLVAVEQNGGTFSPGGAWDSITTAWQSATATDSFTFSSSEGGAGIATFKGTLGPAPQLVRPTSDVSVGAWTTDTGGTTNLYQAIDETSASDTDYIQSETNPAASAVTVGLGSLTDPTVNSGHTLRYRLART